MKAGFSLRIIFFLEWLLLVVYTRPLYATNTLGKEFGFPYFFSPSPNKSGAECDFVLRSGNGIVRFEKESVQFLFIESERVKAGLPGMNRPGLNEVTRSELISLKFHNQSNSSRLIGLDSISSKSNYFTGSNPDKWSTGLPNYNSILYNDLYPGIDLKYYVVGGIVKYDFIIKSGADFSNIRMNYSDNVNLAVNKNGALNIKSELSEILDYIPESYQIIDGKKKMVQVEYILFDMNSVGFKVFDFDPQFDLIIDPALVYSTFVGGANDDYEYTGGVSLDVNGNIFVTGRTFSNDFPATPGVVQANFGGYFDAFLFKLDSTGSNLIYSTFFGGVNADAGYTTKIDPLTNEIYLAGTSASPNFPTTAGTVQPVYGGGLFDAFVLKINSSGNSLIYSTYLGNLQDDYGAGLDIDNLGNAYIVGQSSGPYPATAGAFQSSYAGGPWDVFVTKLNQNGSAIIFSTMLGGPLEDHSHSIKVDSSYNVFIEGFTSGGFPVTAGSYDVTYNGGMWDTYIAKFNSTGTALIFSTYVGGPGADWSWNSFEIDDSGNSYVAGYTQAGFPTTPGAYQTSYGGGPFDAFVYKLNASGTDLIFSTFIGGPGNDQAWGICLNSINEIFITGICQYGFPVSACALDSTIGGTSDAFIAYLNSSGSSVFYSSYIGGVGSDQGYNIIISGNLVYVAGSTSSPDFPVSVNAFDTIHDGQLDIMVFVLDMSNSGLLTAAFSSPGAACLNDSIGLFSNSSGINLSYHWDFGDGVVSNFQNPVHAWTVPGVYNISLIVYSNCQVPDTVHQVIIIDEIPTAGFVASDTCNNVVVFSNFTTGTTTAFWNFGDGSSSYVFSPSHSYPSPGTYSVSLISISAAGCKDTISDFLTVNAQPYALFSYASQQCKDSVSFFNQSLNASSYEWNFGDGGSSTSHSPTYLYSSPGAYMVELIIENSDGCRDSLTQAIIVSDPAFSSFSFPDTICTSLVQFRNESFNATGFLWDFGDGTSSIESSPVHYYSTPGVYTVYLFANSTVCPDTSFQRIYVNKSPDADFQFETNCNAEVKYFNTSFNAGSYFWNFGDGNSSSVMNPNHSYVAGGEYFVTLSVTSYAGCVDSISKAVEVALQSIADFEMSFDTCNYTAEFFNLSSIRGKFLWDFNDGVSSISESPVHQFAGGGIYHVNLITEPANTCADTVSKLIVIPERELEYMYIPNAFTPNGDGLNDCFNIVSNEKCQNYQLTMFNRWGEMIYSAMDLTGCWDGTINGRLVPSDVYCYILINENGNKQGLVSVIY